MSSTETIDLTISTTETQSISKIASKCARRIGELAEKSLPENDLISLNNSIKSSYNWGKNNMKEIIDYASRKIGIEENIIEDYYSCLSFSMGQNEKNWSWIILQICQRNE